MRDLAFKLHMMHRFWRFRLRKERFELAFVRRLKLNGSTVFDIGANKGVYSYWLCRAVGRNGGVFAFEPQPELQPQLARVKSAFNLANLKIIDKACSEKPGTARLYRNFSGAGHASIDHIQGRSESVEVEMTTLDAFAKDHGIADVSFIKLDVEGHELNVLMGGETLLRKARPLLLLECHWKQAEDRRLFDFLGKLGFDGFCFSDHGLCHVSKIDLIKRGGGHGSFVFGPADYINKHATSMAGMPWLADGEPIRS